NEDEINAYFAAGRVKMPAGLKQVSFALAPGEITSNLVVDFDQLTAGRRSQNPLLGLFTGIHNVKVLAHGEASGGVARAHIDSAPLKPCPDTEPKPDHSCPLIIKPALASGARH